MKTLSLSLGNGLDAELDASDERINEILDLIHACSNEGENFFKVDRFRGAPGTVSALSVVGYNIKAMAPAGWPDGVEHHSVPQS